MEHLDHGTMMFYNLYDQCKHFHKIIKINYHPWCYGCSPPSKSLPFTLLKIPNTCNAQKIHIPSLCHPHISPKTLMCFAIRYNLVSYLDLQAAIFVYNVKRGLWATLLTWETNNLEQSLNHTSRLDKSCYFLPL